MQLTTHTFAKRLIKQVQLPYLLALPEDTTPPPWPLLLFLHGSGERGTDLEAVWRQGLPRELRAGRRLPFVVVAPQCPPNTIWSVHLDALGALIDEVQQQYPIDPARLLVTGLSMGGTGTWHLAATEPHRFAAIAPVCGNTVWFVGDPAQLCVLRHLPVWAFHGARDTVIPLSASQLMVETLQACGGDARLTVYPDADHDSWTRAYETPALYEWLARQRRAP